MADPVKALARKASRAAWYQSVKPEQRARTAAWRRRHPELSHYHATRLRAQKHGIPFDLLPEDVIVPERCPVLGIPFVRGTKTLCDGSPTLDRMIPSLGYVRGNVTVISARANRIKSDASLAELRRVLRYVERGLRLVRPV